MSDALIAAFDDCLNALEAGASLEAVLARYPALADELRPMLLAAQAVRPDEPLRVPKQSEDASRARFLARARVLRSARRPAPGLFPQLSFALRLAVWLVVVLTAGALGSFGLVSGASQSLPGDLLYDVKRSAEQVQLALAADPAARAALESQLEARRLLEAQAVVAQGRAVAVAFTGVVEQQAGDRWVIAGLTVSVPAGQGAGLGIGRRVHVSGVAQADGVIRADRIEPADDGTPAPPTPTLPGPSPTPAPTESAEPSKTPEDRETERVEPTRTPSATRTARPGSSPTHTPKLGSGSSPSSTPPPPAASNTPPADPTMTAAPTSTTGGGGGAAPTATPQPNPTATADPEPEPSETDEPDEVEFTGIVEATGAVWVISGQPVTITGETDFDNNPGLGDEVRVKAWSMPDGSLVARRIEKR